MARTHHDGDNDSRRSSYSARYEPMPDCYYGLCVRLLSLISGLGRIGLAGWNIHLQIESMAAENYYAHVKFALFWGDALVLISTPFALKAGIWVNRITLQIHALLSSIALLGPVLQLCMSCISLQLDGKGIDPSPEEYYSYKAGKYQRKYAGNEADPWLAIHITIATACQIFMLCLAVCIHGKALKKKEGWSPPARRRATSRALQILENGSRQSSPERPFDCYLSRDEANYTTTPQISEWMESPRLNRRQEEGIREEGELGEWDSNAEQESEQLKSKYNDSPPAYETVVGDKS